MSTTNQPAKAQRLSVRFNRIMYVAFVLLSVYFLATGAYEDSAVNLGIALIFDPFDQTVSWDHRPFWQRLWLVVHLLVMICIGLAYWKSFGA